MSPSAEQSEKLARMSFASVYPHYVAKIEKKGRSREELEQVIAWFTGYNRDAMETCLNQKLSFREFFAGANLPSGATLITGLICGYRIEEIEDCLVLK